MTRILHTCLLLLLSIAILSTFSTIPRYQYHNTIILIPQNHNTTIPIPQYQYHNTNTTIPILQYHNTNTTIPQHQYQINCSHYTDTAYLPPPPSVNCIHLLHNSVTRNNAQGEITSIFLILRTAIMVASKEQQAGLRLKYFFSQSFGINTFVKECLEHVLLGGVEKRA